MNSNVEEHSKPLLPVDTAHRTSSELECLMRKESCSPDRFYERRIFLYASIFWFAGAVLLCTSAVFIHTRSTGKMPDLLIYSPVNSHVRYKTVIFDPSSGKGTIYMQDPSPTVDQAWEALYDFGLSWITASEAAQLPNATARLPEDTSHYVTGLDVFHQLRCLDIIRKRLYPQYYVNHTNVHFEHCLDQIRQSLMCSADTATIPWSWSKSQERTIPSVETTHTCRDFDALRDWAKGRHVEGEFDKYVFVEGSAISA